MATSLLTQHGNWGKFWEAGLSAYWLSWTFRYHFELNCVHTSACMTMSDGIIIVSFNKMRPHHPHLWQLHMHTHMRTHTHTLQQHKTPQQLQKLFCNKITKKMYTKHNLEYFSMEWPNEPRKNNQYTFVWKGGVVRGEKLIASFLSVFNNNEVFIKRAAESWSLARPSIAIAVGVWTHIFPLGTAVTSGKKCTASHRAKSAEYKHQLSTTANSCKLCFYFFCTLTLTSLFFKRIMNVMIELYLCFFNLYLLNVYSPINHTGSSWGFLVLTPRRSIQQLKSKQL